LLIPEDNIIAIVGPTATGKSQLAIHLAMTFDGEIVSADSRQIYHYLDIGTAKPGTEELAAVPHHLIGIIEPDDSFSLAQYQEMAYQAISDIKRRGKMAILVGGSGLYVWSVLEGWSIPRVAPDLNFRQSLEKEVAIVGADEIHRRLMAVDSAAGERIDPRNTRRVIRALEICKNNYKPDTQPQRNTDLKSLIIGLTAERQELYCRVDSRVDEMIEKGLVEEVKSLIKASYDTGLTAMSGIGYRQIIMYLRNELTLHQAIQQIKYETHRLVRHQYSWFRLKDERIHWFDLQSQYRPAITGLVSEFIECRELEGSCE